MNLFALITLASMYSRRHLTGLMDKMNIGSNMLNSCVPFVLRVLIDPLACFAFRSCNNFLSGHHVFEGKRPTTSRSSSLVSIFDTPLHLLPLFCRLSISHAPAFQQEIGIVFQVEGLQTRFHCFSSASDIRQTDEPKCYFDWVLWECGSQTTNRCSGSKVSFVACGPCPDG